MARTIIDLCGDGNVATIVGKGQWVPNPFTLAFAHIHLRCTGAGSATVIIEGTLDPLNGDGGAVPLFTSDPAASGRLNADDTGDAGQLYGSAAWVRYNVTAISGTGANLNINLSGDR